MRPRINLTILKQLRLTHKADARWNEVPPPHLGYIGFIEPRPKFAADFVSPPTASNGYAGA